MKNFKKLLLVLLSVSMLNACGIFKKTAQEDINKKTETVEAQQVKTGLDALSPRPQELTSVYTKEEERGWQLTDPLDDKFAGMSVEKAYKEILSQLPGGDTVVVAVLDTGMDINHEDLKDVIWTNKDEIPGNGIDDDHNGYVDDVHGWNFLGNRDGRKAYEEQLELTRIVAKYRPVWQDKTIDQIPEKEREMFKLYQRAEKALKKKLNKAKRREALVKMRMQEVKRQEQLLKDFLKTDTLTVEKVKTIKTDNEEINQAKNLYLSGVFEGLKDYYNFVESQIKYNLNIDFNGRAVVGDNPDDINDRNYGNPDVTPVNADEAHATHVAGIIAAKRHNGIGMDGVADKVLIMPIRAVPDGDEYDKDIALGIRYAVDNGAKIINMSFGKYFSPHKEWVWDAIEYARQHDVLLVNAAGNDAKDMDQFGENISYPNDGEKPGEDKENFITIGASGPIFGSNLPAVFSNYGKTTVDVFSPGVNIYSTVPFSDYASFNGTSMAAPDAAGVAALIRSRFPGLTAGEVKEILMKSGITPAILVFVPDESGKNPPEVKPFSELSKSGKIINAYNALLMAKKMCDEKKKTRNNQ